MQFPTNGRVVIVDDNVEEEALPLVRALSNLGIAVRVFNGRESELPEKPLGAVRLLFLDLNLEGLDFIHDPEDKAKALKPVVERIIGESNGPYILFGWTKTPQYLEILYRVLDNKPILYLDMEKNDCYDNDVFSISKIDEKLLKRMTEIGQLRTLFYWENVINEASALTVNKIFEGILELQQLESILFSLAKARLGENIDSISKEQKTKASLQCFNILLSNTVDMTLNTDDFSSFGEVVSSTELNKDIIGKINSKLLLNHIFDKKPHPGNVYIEFDSNRKEKVLDFIKERIDFGKIDKIASSAIDSRVQGAERDAAHQSLRKEIEETIIDENKRIFVEITPLCDYAQNNHKYYRIISGFLIDCDHYKKLDKNVPDKIAFYVSPTIFLENDKFTGCFKLILDHRGLVTLDLNSLKDFSPLFRINNELLFDIQHKAGSHFSRPGIISLS
jgi:hypothetical protein